MNSLLRLSGLGFTVIILLSSGCKNNSADSPSAPQGPTNYLGVFASAFESGTITLAIGGPTPSAVADTVSGTLRLLLPSASTIPLAGTLKGDTLAVRGGGFRLSGLGVGARLTGTFVDPASIVGGFATQLSVNSAGTTYCGTYTSQGSGENGIFDLVITGITVSGVTISATGQDLLQLDGSVLGTTITIPGVGAGAINGNTLSGSFSFASNHGIWSATVCE